MEKRECLNCSNIFKAKKKSSKYCCRKCSDIGKGKLILGENHPNWSGGRHIDSAGYVVKICHNHPCSHKGYVLEHRLVMEKHLGRFLNKDEIVHHINHIKTDNRIENLIITNVKKHIHDFHNNLKWARIASECVRCGNNNIPHQARGLCKKCYRHQYFINFRK